MHSKEWKYMVQNDTAATWDKPNHGSDVKCEIK